MKKFDELVKQARAREQMTAEAEARALKEREVKEAIATQAEDDEKVDLSRIWTAVTDAMVAENPTPDIMIVDDHQLREFLLYNVEASNRQRKKRWNESKRGEVADRMAVSAWDMVAKFSRRTSGPEASWVAQLSMHLGSNGIVYCGVDPNTRTPNGTHTGWEVAYNSSDKVSGVWTPQGEAPIDSREEIATGFAELVARHSLQVEV